jgi:tetratricopeptide (TPR) repeat protein
VIDVVRAICGLAEAASPETLLEKFQVALSEIGMDASAFVPFLLHLLERSEQLPEHLAGLSPEVIKVRTFETLRQMSLRESRRRPLIIAVEDLHWVDRTSEEYLASLVEALAGVPIMLLATYRPGYRPSWMDRSYATQLSLVRLTSADSLTVVQSVLPAAGLTDSLASLILDKAEGNPFFLEELARAVGEQPPLPSGLIVPDTVHGVLAARIDRLAEVPKRLLQTASVLGREFSVRLLDAVWDGGALDPHLQELRRQEFLYESSGRAEATYMFKHALTQDVAEATVLGPRRRELHRRAAEALETFHPDRPAELAPLLAHHYFQAEAWARACEQATLAAEVASAVYANREALEHYNQALLAAERAILAPTDLMRLHAARGGVHGVLGDFEAARADLESALVHARTIGDASTRADLLGSLGELWGGHRDYQRGLELTLEAVQTAEGTGNRRALAEALLRTGLMHLNLARISESQQELERALAIFEELGDEHGGARTLDVLSTADGITAHLHRSIGRSREALRRYQVLGDRMAQSSVMTTLGFWLATVGSRREAEALVGQGLQAAIDLGARSAEAYAHGMMGWILGIYGEYGLALRESAVALELARRIGHREWTALGLSRLGRITRICGLPARARALHEEMLGITRELGTVLWTANALAELGEDLIALGDEGGGVDLLNEAVATGREAAEFTVPPLLAQADILLHQSRPQEALATARRAQQTAGQYRVLTIEAQCLEGEALVALGSSGEGARLLRDVKVEATAIEAAPLVWRTALALGDHLSAQGRHDEASAQRAEARKILDRAAADLSADLRPSFDATGPVRRARGE